MRRLVILLVLIVIMIIGGGLTSQIASSEGSVPIPGLVRQTDDPDASALDMTPWKAEQLFLVILFILFSPFPPGLIPLAIGLTLLMWFLDWQVRATRAKPGPSTSSETTPTVAEET